MVRYEFEAIGTHWVIDIKKELSSEEEALLLKKIEKRINIFDLDYSRFKDNSLVMQMAREAGEYFLPDDADKMLSIYRKLYNITRGKVTPLIGQVLSDAGYDAKYSMQEGQLTTPPDWDSVMQWQNPKLILKEPTLLDFGAGGKGYLVDIVSELIESEGIDTYCVDAGGDMRYRSLDDTKLRVGLEHPEDTKKVIGVANVLNQSICGSAGNRRAWGRFHHVIDPEKLSSPKNILAVWVVANDTLTADILTTGLYFAPASELQKHFDFEYIIVKEDYTFENSENFPAELF